MADLNPRQFGPYTQAREPIPNIDISTMPRYRPAQKIGTRNAVKLSRAIKGGW